MHLVLGLIVGSAGAQDFTYTTTNGSITITGYKGPGGVVSIPAAISGSPVVEIAASAFDVFVGNTDPASVIAGTPDIPLAIEASAGPAAASWTELQTCTLTNGLIYFSDAQWMNHQSRLYRIRGP